MYSSKKQLEIDLSHIKDFEKPKFKLEQYITPSSIAATVLWDAYMDDLLDDSFLDLGSGTGMFTIGASLMGCKEVTAIEIDSDAIDIFMKNIDEFGVKGISIHNFDINDQTVSHAKVCITNPPFGVKDKGADKKIIEFAMNHADTIYSFHKLSTADHLRDFISNKGFEIEQEFKFQFPLRNKMSHHKSKLKYIDVICFKYSKSH